MGLIPQRIAARLAHRHNLVRVLDNIAWLALDRALKLALGLFVTAWLARHLGPEQFGTYNYVFAFVALFGTLATLGIPAIAVRELVREPERRAEILGTSLALVAVGSLVAAGLATLAAGWVRPQDLPVRIGVAIIGCTWVFQSTAVVRWWFESQVAVRHLLLPENTALVIAAGVRVVLILNDAPLTTFFWVQLLEAAMIAAFLPIAYAMQVGDLRRWRPVRSRALQLLRDGWPLVLAGVITMVQARIDQLVLASMVGDLELGYYSGALRVAENLVFVALALQSSMFPILVDARRQSEAEFRRKLLMFYRVSSAVALLICIPVALLGPWLVHWLLGPAYAPAGTLLALMSGRIFLAFMGLARAAYLTIENMQRYATLTTIFGTALNLLLNLLWIPSFQAQGAVWASLVSFVITIFVLDLFILRVRGNALDMLRAVVTPRGIWRP